MTRPEDAILALRLRLLREAVGGVRFGAPPAPPPAPPPPDVGWPFTPDDVRRYGAYVEDRVTAMDRAWAAWHTAKWWRNDIQNVPLRDCTPGDNYPADASAPCCDPSMPDEDPRCNPLFVTVKQRADDWSAGLETSVIDPHAQGWPAWSAAWHTYYNEDILGMGAIGWMKAQACGGFCGDYTKTVDAHHQLQRFAALANQAGLVGVPDAGKVAEPKGAVDKVLGSSVTSDILGLGLLVGGMVLVGTLVANVKKTPH